MKFYHYSKGTNRKYDFSPVLSGEDVFFPADYEGQRTSIIGCARYWARKEGVKVLAKETDEGVWVFNVGALSAK